MKYKLKDDIEDYIEANIKDYEVLHEFYTKLDEYLAICGEGDEAPKDFLFQTSEPHFGALISVKIPTDSFKKDVGEKLPRVKGFERTCDLNANFSAEEDAGKTVVLIDDGISALDDWSSLNDIGVDCLTLAYITEYEGELTFSTKDRYYLSDSELARYPYFKVIG